MYRYLTFCCTCRPHVLNCFQPWGTWVSGIYFRYCFDDLFPPVIIVFVPVLPETACLSPWFIVYLLPCTSCQIAVHRIPCYRVLYFPVLPPARINHGIWRNRSTHVVLLLTHSYSVLCLVMICFPSFMIIRGRAGNTEHFRVTISDMKVFIDQSWTITLALFRLIINPCCQDSTGSQKHSSPTHLLHCKAVLWHLLWLWFSWTHRLYWPESVVPAAFSFHHA